MTSRYTRQKRDGMRDPTMMYPDPLAQDEAVLPDSIYRRRLTNVFYTVSGDIFCWSLDPRMRYYRYSATTADRYGDVEIWRLHLEVPKPSPLIDS